MSCYNCIKKPVWTFTNKRQICRTCFAKYFEKKVRRTIRKFRLIEEKDIISVADNVLFSTLKNKIKSRGIKITRRRTKNTNKTALADTLDNEAEKIINHLIRKNITKNSDLGIKTKINKIKVIKPFYFMLSKEVQLYAKLKKLKYKAKKKQTKIGRMLNSLEKSHPEIKNAIVNGYLTLFLPAA